MKLEPSLEHLALAEAIHRRFGSSRVFEVFHHEPQNYLHRLHARPPDGLAAVSACSRHDVAGWLGTAYESDRSRSCANCSRA